MGDPGKYARMQLAGYRLKAAEISELAVAYQNLERANAQLRDEKDAWHSLGQSGILQIPYDFEADKKAQGVGGIQLDAGRRTERLVAGTVARRAKNRA